MVRFTLLDLVRKLSFQATAPVYVTKSRCGDFVKDNCFSALTAQAVRFRHGARLHQIKRTRVFAVQVNCKQLPDRFSLRKHRSLK